MPLNMQLFGDKANGHIMISGKEIIFAWRFYESDENTKITASINRRKFREFLLEYNPLVSLMIDNDDKTYAGTDDPRHLPLAHVSVYDYRLCIHYHLTFKENITFNILSSVFSPLRPHTDKASDVFSKECLDYLLETAKGYFLQLETSKEAQAIEAAYRLEKEEEFKMATIEAKKIKKKQMPSNSLFSLLSNLEKTTTALTLLNAIDDNLFQQKKKKTDKPTAIQVDFDSLLSGLFPPASSSTSENKQSISSSLKK